MPGGDGTGPMGMGPMTGRAEGYCAGFAAPGFVTGGGGRGFWGRGGGRGRGWRNRFYATGLTGWQRAAMGGPVVAAPVSPVSGEQQLDALKRQAEHFEQALQGIREQIKQFQQERQSENG